MEPNVEQQHKLEHILSRWHIFWWKVNIKQFNLTQFDENFRMSSSLSLDLSNCEKSFPEKDQDNEDGFNQIETKPKKIIPIGKHIFCKTFS